VEGAAHDAVCTGKIKKHQKQNWRSVPSSYQCLMAAALRSPSKSCVGWPLNCAGPSDRQCSGVWRMTRFAHPRIQCRRGDPASRGRDNRLN
jgi:hypothetical protein